MDDTHSETSGTASDETITFLCGCQECTIDDFLNGTVGCKNPGKSDRFPLLDTSTISSDKQLDMISQLNEDADSIDAAFSSVVTDIAISFSNRNANINVMKLYLCSLEAIKARATIENPDSLLHPFLERIQSFDTIIALFLFLASFWSWFNYGLLEKLVNKFGNLEEKSLMKEYEEELKMFLERHVFEIPSSIHSPKEINGFTKFNVKLADKIRRESASEIPMIRKRFAQLLEVETHSLILTSIKSGCVELCFLVPEQVSQLFPLAAETLDEIFNIEWPICQIACGNNEPQIIRDLNTELEDNENVLYDVTEPLVAQIVDDDKHSVVSGSSGVTGSISTAKTVSEQSGVDSGTSESGYANSELGIGNEVRVQQKPKEVNLRHYRGIHWVCQACLLHNPYNERLLECTCCNTTLHDGVYPIVAVAWNENEHMMVQIRQLPQLSLLKGFALCNGTWCKGEKCTFAHSDLEKMAWNYEVNMMKKAGHHCKGRNPLPALLEAVPQVLVISPVLIPNYQHNPRQIIRFSINRKDNYQVYNRWKGEFKNRLERTKLKDDDLEPNLTIDNYQDKFYALLCFEEMEHIRLLTEKCDGSYDFFLLDGVPEWLTKLSYENPRNVGCLEGITGDQVSYATQSSEGLFIVDRTDDTDICRANILSFNFDISTEKKMYISLSDADMKHLHSKFNLDIGSRCVIDVEFEVKHGFFNTLHKAIVNLPHYMISKLMPRPEDFQAIAECHISNDCKHSCLKVNKGCQLAALSAVVSSSCKVPILISGPFGCGKTRILARAAYEFVENGLKSQKVTRILICAHHPASTQTYITDYFSNVCASDKNWRKYVKIVRITRGVFERRSHYNDYFRNLSTFRREIHQGEYLNEKCLIIVTTYMTSMQLYYIFKKHGGFFTHILLDEAAQVREPEAVAPLCLAVRESKVIVAGDSKQVGPALVVLGMQAHENGLAISLLERLENHYKSIGGSALPYCTVVVDNYRSNESITHFLSTVFYDQRINTETFVDVHPRASFPFIFYCCDIDRAVRAPQESAFEIEADAVLNQLDYYFDKNRRPRKWSSCQLSVITPTRNQVNLIWQKLQGAWKNVRVLPTYVIQGHEFRAVFLSTCEPLEQDGRSKDPLKSLCNPYVFNTAISRAKSLVVAIGNPFMLLKIEEIMGSRRHCWKEYLRMCLKRGTVFFSRNCSAFLRKKVIGHLHNAVEMQAQESSPFLNEYQSSLPHHLKRLQEQQSQKLLPAPKTSKSITTTTQKMSYAEVLRSGPKDSLTHQVKQINQKTDDELSAMVTLSDDSDNEENERAEYLKNIGYL